MMPMMSSHQRLVSLRMKRRTASVRGKIPPWLYGASLAVVQPGGLHEVSLVTGSVESVVMMDVDGTEERGLPRTIW